MSGYQRFVAYVYEYHKGKKGENCGFIKMEVRSMRCQLQLQLQCVGLTPGVLGRVYGIVRRAGLMDGVLLGTFQTGENITRCLIETDAGDMNHSGFSFEQMGGIVLKTENGAFFGTEWDDQPIRPENFRDITILPKKIILEEAQEKLPESGAFETETEPIKKQPEKAEEEGESAEDPQELSAEKSEPVEEQPEKEVADALKEPPKPEQSEKFLHTQEIPAAKVQTPQPSFFDPFGDGELVQGIQIQIRDFNRLNRKDWGLRNNRFLLYGFYNFGHLLLGKKSDGSCILGVPGVYDQQEQFMANMFGFPYFKESRNIQTGRGKGGYWYRLINTPDFH